jgi:hypothetical protein
MSKIFALLLLALFGHLPAVQAQQSAAAGIVAGHVAFISGAVQTTNPQLTSRTLQNGAPVYVGDQINTQANSHLHLRMVDNAFVALRPASRLTIETYDYNPAQPQASRIRMDLQHGTSRAVSGQGGQAAKHQYRFNTPLAAIGLRGTDYTVIAGADTTRVSVVQGGVIVSPFTADCTSAQLGPCNNPLARELRAGSPVAYLEVKANATPSVNVIPATPRTPGPSSDATVKDNLLLTAAIDRTAFLPADTKAQARWGRWSSLVQAQPAGSGSVNQVLGAMGAFTVVATNNAFALAHPTSVASLLPEQGRVNFSMVAAEAYLQDKGQFIPAQVKTGTLQMDFAQNSFNTQLSVLTPGNVETIQAQGTVDRYGRMQSVATPGSAQLQGIVLNKGLEATYLFDKAISAGGHISGAAQWAR